MPDDTPEIPFDAGASLYTDNGKAPVAPLEAPPEDAAPAAEPSPEPIPEPSVA